MKKKKVIVIAGYVLLTILSIGSLLFYKSIIEIAPMVIGDSSPEINAKLTDVETKLLINCVIEYAQYAIFPFLILIFLWLLFAGYLVIQG